VVTTLLNVIQRDDLRGIRRLLIRPRILELVSVPDWGLAVRVSSQNRLNRDTLHTRI
jgi:hypothetical protein